MMQFLLFYICGWIALAAFSTIEEDETVTGVEKIVIVVVVAAIVMTLFK